MAAPSAPCKHLQPAGAEGACLFLVVSFYKEKKNLGLVLSSPSRHSFTSHWAKLHHMLLPKPAAGRDMGIAMTDLLKHLAVAGRVDYPNKTRVLLLRTKGRIAVGKPPTISALENELNPLARIDLGLSKCQGMSKREASTVFSPPPYPPLSFHCNPVLKYSISIHIHRLKDPSSVSLGLSLSLYFGYSL